MKQKLTPAQQRRVDELRGFVRSVEHVRKLVAELDSNRAARSQVIDNLCGAISRELSQLRQRAMAANVGTVADTAGALGVLANRSGSGISLKIRGLTEGMSSLMIQLDSSLSHAMSPEKKES